MTAIHLKSAPGTAYPYRTMEKTIMPLRAIIFDCDGVLVDSEPLHFLSLKKLLKEKAAHLTEDIYKSDYLAMDDRGAIQTFFQNSGEPLSSATLETLMAQKTKIFQDLVVSNGLLPYPAVPELVMSLAQRYPLAVASGARRHELEMILESSGLRPYFETVISSDDVANGKPHPESYLKALEALNQNGKRPTAIRPGECLVIEDAYQGIASAHKAGMKCIAVATSFPAFELKEADLIVPSLSALRVSQIEDLFGRTAPIPQPGN